ETTTADLSLTYSASGYYYYGEDGLYYCYKLSSRLLVLIGFTMGISLCGLAGNGIVMWVLIFHMKQNPFTVYVLNLAIADFSLLLFLIVFLLLLLISVSYCDFTVNTIWTLNNLIVVFHFCHFSSMYLLTAMFVERCLAAL
ncbi:MAS protein, partial [Galbula dea]|nr:MAS protein [Galbula dea]